MTLYAVRISIANDRLIEGLVPLETAQKIVDEINTAAQDNNWSYYELEEEHVSTCRMNRFEALKIARSYIDDVFNSPDFDGE